LDPSFDKHSQTEMDREDIKHHISMLITEGRLHLAPIGKNPQRVVDIGTGTGTSIFNT
jgi:tRNA G46 methylase TrmB